MKNSKVVNIVAIAVGSIVLSGCYSASRLGEIGSVPAMSQINDPLANPNYKPVTMPMPKPELAETGGNSLWRTGGRAFFKDQRAQQVGDILTILVSLSDNAKISNKTARSRATSESTSISQFLGYENHFKKVLPEGVDPTNLINANSNPTHDGSGSVDRKEDINMKVAAVVNQVLPNGNLVISGRQEIRVNSEIRELLITGIIRPQDILADNTIISDKIAEARISYGGRGHISDMQQPTWGQQVLNTISPF